MKAGTPILYEACSNKMAAKLLPITNLLILLVVSLLVGESQAVFDANQCLSSNAFYNDTTLRCQCADGYKGLGDLCCDKDDEYSNCNLGGDPWLNTYDGSLIQYDWPCVSRVAVVTGTSSAGRQCTIEVMTTTSFVGKGAQYPDRMVVAFSIGSDERQYIKLVGNTIQRPGDPTFYSGSELYRRRLFRLRLSGENIRISFISSRSIWQISGCSAKVTFRAAQGNKAVPSSKPGLCVSVQKSSDMKPSGDLSNGDVCSASDPSSTNNNQVPFKLLSQMITDLKSFANNDVLSIHPTYQAGCEQASGLFEDSCQSDTAKFEGAVKSCAAVLYNGLMRMCLTMLKLPGPKYVEAFSKCVQFHCSQQQASCTTYMGTVPELKTCFPSFCKM